MCHTIKIGRRTVGDGCAVYVIAELSANHGQDFDRAVRLVHAAKAAGADAVKLQTYTADTLTLDSDNEWFKIKSGTIWDGQTLHKLYSQAYTPWEWQPRLKAEADRLKIDLFSSPFDPTAVDFLEQMQVDVYKVASFEIVDLPLIERIARTGKPMIMSTGMATLAEVAEAVQVARAAGAGGLALLKCSSAYPAPAKEMNLRTIHHMRDLFAAPVGLSDHTQGIAVPVAAVTLGATIVEKHLTLSREDGGPDSAFSLEPDEFAAMVSAVRVAQQALGEVRYGPADAELASRCLRRSLFVVRDMKKGALVSSQNVRSIRPADGLPPKYFPLVEGRSVTLDIPAGTPLRWDHVGGKPDDGLAE